MGLFEMGGLPNEYPLVENYGTAHKGKLLVCISFFLYLKFQCLVAFHIFWHTCMDEIMNNTLTYHLSIRSG